MSSEDPEGIFENMQSTVSFSKVRSCLFWISFFFSFLNSLTLSWTYTCIFLILFSSHLPPTLPLALSPVCIPSFLFLNNHQFFPFWQSGGEKTQKFQGIDVSENVTLSPVTWTQKGDYTCSLSCEGLRFKSFNFCNMC